MYIGDIPPDVREKLSAQARAAIESAKLAGVWDVKVPNPPAWPGIGSSTSQLRISMSHDHRLDDWHEEIDRELRSARLLERIVQGINGRAETARFYRDFYAGRGDEGEVKKYEESLECLARALGIIRKAQ